MELALWTYEGPPHIGAMRIATSMTDVHCVLHAPQGDTYADLLFTMIERQGRRPPVTYTTFQAQDLGGDTADLVKSTIAAAYDRFKPNALLVGESCTAELIQDQPGALARGMNLPVPVVPLELPAYSKKENWGASESLYYVVRHLLLNIEKPEFDINTTELRKPKANIIGPSSLGFRCRDDVVELTRLLNDIGVAVNVVAPLDASVADIQRIPEADFNINLYPELSRTTCTWLKKAYGMPFTQTIPIGVNATLEFIVEVEQLTGIDASHVKQLSNSRLPWYSRSVDSTYLTGKRVFIFGDGTHALTAARIARDELGFEVVGLGTFSREMAKDVRAYAKELGLEALISDDYLTVEEHIEELNPELVLGTQMERHIAKRLGLPCAVISTPIHVQDVPARYSPQVGFEGANVIFDSWVHPLLMGLEEHLLHMFRDDFEFNDQATPSHLHGSDGAATLASVETEHAAIGANTNKHSVAGAAEGVAVSTNAKSNTSDDTSEMETGWTTDAELELKKIPFFVRGKARNNTEKFAKSHGHVQITVDTLYEAKAFYAR